MANTIASYASYFDRNSAWLRPLAISLVLLSLHPLMQVFENGASALIPFWLTTGAALAALAVSGFYAFMTNTLSAKIMRFLATAAVIASLLLSLLSFIL